MKRIVATAAWLCLILPVTTRAAELAPAASGVAGPLAAYGRIHDALAGDRTDGIAAAAAEISGWARSEAAKSLAKSEAKANLEALERAAAAMNAADLAALRKGLDGLSKSLAAAVNATGAGGTQLYYCPMADAYWIQRKGDEKVRNPYYGKSMLGCGEKVDKVER